MSEMPWESRGLPHSISFIIRIAFRCVRASARALGAEVEKRVGIPTCRRKTRRCEFIADASATLSSGN